MGAVSGVVRVRVPATSANLGPGFDSLGLALGLYDDVDVEVGGHGIEVVVEGEGQGEVALDGSHLVVRALLLGLRAAGAAAPGGLKLLCRNAIPHGRGLGSSASAAVAGLLAARRLLAEGLGPPSAAASLDDDRLLALATGLEGHPDNAAAALLGGATIAWTDPHGPRAVRLDPHPDVEPVLCVPVVRLSTATARAVLPTSVPHDDAAANAARAALLVEALTRRPDLLLPATQDRIHQRQRASSMPRTLELVDALRDRGHAAVVSGAGPSVLVLSTRSEADRVARDAAALCGPGVSVLRPGVDLDGARHVAGRRAGA